MSLGTLTIDVEANTARLTEGLDRAAQVTQASMGRMMSQIGNIGVVIGATTAATAAAVTQMLSTSAQLADEIGKISIQSGLSVESLSGLRFAAQQSDTDFATLSGGLKKLRITQAEAAGGNKELAGLFKALGVEVTNTDGSLRKSEDVFMDLADAYTGLGSEQERSAVLMKLMGKSAEDLGIMMLGGSDGIRKLQDEAGRLGVVLSGQTAGQVKTMMDNIDALKASVDGLGIAMLSNLAPSLERITSRMREAAAEGGILESVLVGIGGVISESLNLDPTQVEKLDSQLEDLAARVEEKKRLMFFTEKGSQTDFSRNMIGNLKKQIAELEGQMDALKKKRDELLNPPAAPEKTGGAAPGGGNLLGGIDAGDKAAEQRAKDAKALQQAYDQMDASLRQQVALFGEVTEAAKVRYEVEMGGLRGISERQRQHLESIAAELDAKKKQSEEGKKAEQGLKELEALRKQLLTEEEAIAESYRRRQEIIMGNTQKGSDDQADLLRRNDEKRNSQQQLLEYQKNSMLLQSGQDMFDSLAGITEAFGGKQSAAYKTMFAASKAFAVAQAILQLNQAIMMAAGSTPFPENLAAMAMVAGSLGGVVSAIQGAQFSGAYDSGGYIPPGKVGLVGEFGPELISGPANVTSRRDTAEAFRSSRGGRSMVINMNISGVSDADSFRRSTPQLTADLKRRLGAVRE